MNARQKAKKYKRMYEALSTRSKPPIVFNEEQYTIDTLRVSMILPKHAAILGNDYIMRIAFQSLVEELTKYPGKYIDGYTEYLPYDASHRLLRLHCQIKVLRKLPKLEAEK